MCRAMPGRIRACSGLRSVTMAAMTSPVLTPAVTDERIDRLRRFNLVMGVLHLVSGVFMWLSSNDFELQVSSFTLNGPPGTALSEGELFEAFSFPLGFWTAMFLFLSAAAHLYVSTIGFDVYRAELRAGRNRIRWVEYSLSATLMIVLIALVTGVTDTAALIAIVGANVSMILFGWLMETVNPPGSTVYWSPFWFGCIAGAAPWLAIAASVALSVGEADDGGPPGFVYGILVTIFVMFNTFAIVQWLQYRGKGRFADYAVGESTYIWLSLIAKSLLAWQIWANTLID